MVSSPVRWGIVATGRIAGTMASELSMVPDAKLVAVASRDGERAQQFAHRHGAERAYGSYAELFADPEVDVVYIATPHAQHHAVARQALLADKHVLVEKAFTCRLEAAEDLVSLARERKLFLMEAMKTRFRPMALHLKELVESGAIGEIHGVRADLGFAKAFDPSSRLWDAEQGGGATLDVGVYCVAFAHWLLGAPASVQAVGELAPNGVDASVALQLGYAEGRYAQLAFSLSTEMVRTASVLGSQGSLEVGAPFHHMSQVTLRRLGQDPEVFTDDNPHSMVGELQEVTQRILAGDLASPGMPWDDTISIMRTMDIALDQLGAVRTDEGFIG